MNSSFEQFMKTLALYIDYRNEWLVSTKDEFVFGNDLFEDYVKQIDRNALHDANDDAFWSRVMELLRFEEIGYGMTYGKCSSGEM